MLRREWRKRVAAAKILISHDLSVVRYLCEQVAVMRDGQLVEYGETKDVLDAPRTTYTRDLVAAIPRLSAAEHALPSVRAM